MTGATLSPTPAPSSAPTRAPTTAVALTATSPRVLVVGAGISGLAAAKTLVAAGYNVTILEARNRLGGRMYTDRKTMSIPADVGAGWIHQGVGNPITDLANQYSVAWKVGIVTHRYLENSLTSSIFSNNIHP